MDIVMPRGDLWPVAFTAYNQDETDPINTFDEIYFTVKKRFTDRLFLFQKRLSKGEIFLNSNNNYQFSILPKDTDRLPFGEYVFDIELVRGDEFKQTFTGRLILTEEATYAENEL